MCIRDSTLAASHAIQDIAIVEANDYVGGRVHSVTFQNHTVEWGANWISGKTLVQYDNDNDNDNDNTSGRRTQVENPVWKLAQAIDLQGHPSERDDARQMLVLDTDTSTVVTTEYLKQVERFEGIYGRALEARKQLEDSQGGSNANNTKKHNPQVQTQTSVRSILEEYGWTPKANLTHLERAVEHNLLEVWVSESLEDLSSEYDMKPGANDVELGQEEVFVEDARGFHSIFDDMVQDLLRDNDNDTPTTTTKIHLQTQVQSIHYTPGKTKVVTKGLVAGGTVTEYHADVVVCTVSLGVLQSNQIDFHPPLPAWKVAALDQMKMFHFAKVYAKFPKRLWPADKDYLVFITPGEAHRGHYPLWMRYKHTSNNDNSNNNNNNNNTNNDDNTTDHNNHLLMCYLGGAQARRVEALTEEQLKDDIQALFQKGFGRPAEDCRPVAVAVTDWSRNPRFCGSYSYFPKGAFASLPYSDLLRGLTGWDEKVDQEQTNATTSPPPPPSMTTLHFAGEAFHDKYNGWVQGGILSGEQVAKDILRGSILKKRQ